MWKGSSGFRRCERMRSESVVLNSRSLAKVVRAFRSVKSIDLHIRPIRHLNDDRIRMHVFRCMLAYYVEWHMPVALRELIFDGEDIAGAQATLSRNIIRFRSSASEFFQLTESTTLQRRDFELLATHA